MKGFVLYWMIINVATFLIYGLDKHKAKYKRWRIPEKILLGLAVLGGSVGALAGMRVFHHKTKKMKFSVGIPFILILQIGIGVCCIFFLFK